jgi:hypothetical protein
MTQTIRYTVPVHGTRRELSYTTEQVGDAAAAWDPDKALAYARHLAADEFGHEAVDVTEAEVVQMGDEDAGRDETGGAGYGGPL